jgi:hypothetical protein
MCVATQKISITVDEALLAAVKKRVGARGVSRFFSEAASERLDHEDLVDFVAELEREYGPPNEQYVAEAIAALDELEEVKRKMRRGEV